MVSDVIDELVQIASTHKCSFPADFKDKTIRKMLEPSPEPSTMYQDYTAQRPMEVETYLGVPSTLGKSTNIKTPRIDTLYAILRHINAINKDRPPASPAVPAPHVRGNSFGPAPSRMSNGSGRGIPPRPPNMGGPMMPPGRRPPPPANGFRGPPNGYPPRGPSQLARHPSFEENSLDEFSHVVLYDEIPEGDVAAAMGDGVAGNAVSLRERELALREKELAMREHEMVMNRRGGRRISQGRGREFDDEDDDDEYFDPTAMRGPPTPQIDPDNFDMMSVTSRRNKRTINQNQLRGGMGMRPGPFGRNPMNRPSRASAQILSEMPSLGENILDNPMMGFASNRYANVDRKEIADESRANSLTASRLHEMGQNGGPFPPIARRTSRSPGNPFGPPSRGMGRPSPPNDMYPGPGPARNGAPPMQAPVARYPPGKVNMVHPQQVEQQAGVSKPFPPPKGPPKSLTGSASASAGSGDSGSGNIESEPSAHSSTSSFAPRPLMAMH